MLAAGATVAVLVRERASSAPDGAPFASSSPGPVAPAATEAVIAAAPAGSSERNRGLALAIESAMLSRDAGRRETALAELLPALIAADAGSVAAIVARQPPGEGRDLLRDEVARVWVRRDRDSAIAWIKSLEDSSERRGAAITAMHGIAASDPAQAIIVADELGVGRDDGSLEHIVQIWAASDPDGARRWLAGHPAGDPGVAALRARIEAELGTRAAR